MRIAYIVLLLVPLTANAACAVAAETAEQQAAQRIADDLKQSGLLKDYRIGVKYKEGVAHLLGTVTSEQQKQLAERVARTSDGVRRVVSRLDVVSADEMAAGAPGSTSPMRNDRLVRHADVPANLPPLPKSSPVVAHPSRGAANGASPLPYAASRVRDVRPAQFARPQGRPQGQMQAGRGRQVQRANYARQNRMPMRTAANYPPRQPQYPPRQPQYPPRQPRPIRQAANHAGGGPNAYAANYGGGMGPMPTAHVPGGIGRTVSYDNPQMPGYAWPSYASSPNYAALTYPRQYSPSAWPYIGPFYPYPQVPLGWRKVTLEWDDGWWFLDFKDSKHCCCP